MGGILGRNALGGKGKFFATAAPDAAPRQIYTPAQTQEGLYVAVRTWIFFVPKFSAGSAIPLAAGARSSVMDCGSCCRFAEAYMQSLADSFGALRIEEAQCMLLFITAPAIGILLASPHNEKLPHRCVPACFHSPPILFMITTACPLCSASCEGVALT